MRARNDPGQYDELAGEWWRPGGTFELLHWLAAARGALIPPATRPAAVLVDAGCGGGLLGPHVARLGYRHVGVDLRRPGLEQSAARDITPVNGDVTALPLATSCADVVAAGEILEHVTDLPGAVAELSRVLRPGGLVVLDTLNDSALGRFITVTAGEGLGIAPHGLHDPELFVKPRRLIDEFRRHGVDLRIRGIRPTMTGLLRWLTGRPPAGGGPFGRMVPTFSSAVLYQGRGRKREGYA
ncbi:methyltransferase domain-containing protein [Actinoplanes sp. NBRC 103695]|uniref:methyltransferase domain-containing protein n=1 Tax=Actinoplanes sp. NBRC 103695 TaxID=3032202 RepID=UPI0024A0FEA9|nr:methyltransferase domain-containing protein [Actinoplanes sp. NBRC 103695]GLY97020.1 ubiquinone biosynthesis O-methyltransferase [Actinoplanes sp. NBRC 103695]